MREIILTVPPSFEGAQAQDYLKHIGFSRRSVVRLKQTAGLTRNGAVLRTIDPVHTGEEIRVLLSDDGTELIPNPELTAPRVYEDEDIVVFSKPPFMPVHPSIRHYSDTLANLFAALYPGLPFRPVNRLDRNTSGLCVCAKNRFAAAALSGSLNKVYFAVTGKAPPGNVINAPIGRADSSIIKRRVDPGGKPAVTRFEIIGGNERHSLLRVTLETGRTHQIRVHFSYISFPLCGDEMYGGDCSEISRQALHCGEVSFTQPLTKEIIRAAAPLPGDMAALIGGKL